MMARFPKAPLSLSGVSLSEESSPAQTAKPKTQKDLTPHLIKPLEPAEQWITRVLTWLCHFSLSFSTKVGTVLPDNYTCYRCGNTGHHIRNCPTAGDKSFEGPQKIKKSTGIPRSFMVEVDDPNIKGVMMTNCGRFAIPAIDAQAYAIGKKEKPPFVPQEEPKPVEEHDPIPDELLCLICHDLLSDSVVIPCCGNSYCDECIRTALLDSEDHVCPTCGQAEVSPDTLIANKFLRQAVNNYNKEQGNKSSQGQCGTSMSKNSTPTPSPVPTPPPASLQTPVQKPLQSSCSPQDSHLNLPKVSKTPPLSQGSDVPPPATNSASAANTPNTFLQAAQSHAVVSNNDTEGKTHDDSAAAASSVLVSDKDPIDAPSQLNSLLNNSQVAEPVQKVEENLWVCSLDSVPTQSGSSTLRDSTSSSSGFPAGGLTDSSAQQPSSSVTSSSSSSSSYPTTPSPLFPSPLFHTFIPTHQPHSNYPPGYQPTTPVWTLPAPKGAPIPSLCPSTSVSPASAFNPNEWYSQQRKERSPYRRSPHAKSKSYRSYSRSTSRSGSRSRSRSRPRSSYSSKRDYRSRFHSTISNRFGYHRPRSPTPSSSSSSRGGYESKSNSHHQKSRHHSKGSASKMGKEKWREQAGGSLNSQHTNDTSSLELDRQRYLQWTKEYQEWYEKYFSSYTTHFHQLPPPPSPYLQDPRCPPPSRLVTGSMKDCSPSSESSSGSRSPSYKSSSDSHSSASHSLSDSCHSPRSHSSSDGRSSKSKDRATLQEQKTENKQVILKNDTNSVKHEQKRTKKLERRKVEDSCSSDSGDCTDDGKKGKKSVNTEPNARKGEPNARKGDTELGRTAITNDALEPVQPSPKVDHPLDKDYEKPKAKKEKRLEREQGWRRGEDSNSMRRKHKIKHAKKPERVGGRREHPDNRKDPDSLLGNKRKRAGPERKERNSRVTVKPRTAEASEDPESREGESSKLSNRKKQNTEEKKEKKCSLTEKDIWEGGIKVMPQKKISININLCAKRKEEKTDQENSPITEICPQETTSQTRGKEESWNEDKTEMELNKKGELSEENILDDKIKPDEQEERQMWKEVTCKDKEEEWGVNAVDEGDGEKKAAGKEDSWHHVLTVGEEESVMGKEEAERVRHACREEMDTSVLRSQEQRGEEESPCRENGDNLQREEEGDGCNNTPEDGSCASMVGDCAGEESHDKKTVVESHTENTQDHGEEIQNDLVLEQLYFTHLSQERQSRWENKEEQDGEDIRVRTDTHTVATLHPSEPLTNNETLKEDETLNDDERQRPRSAEGERDREKVAERGRDKEKQRSYTLPWTQPVVTPSSGRDRPDSHVPVDRNREMRTERYRDRERRDSERQKEDKRSKQETREEGRRDWERNKMTSVQRRNPPSYSHSSPLLTSQETERRHWQRRGGQCSSKSSSSVGGWGSSSISSPTNPPDPNASKTCRALMSLDLKSKDNDHVRQYCNQGPSVSYRDRYKPATAHSSSHRKDRDPLFGESLGGPQRASPDWEIQQSKRRNESRGEKGERKPERVLKTGREVEGKQKPSSSSSTRSSANHDNAKDKREKEKQHKYEKRHAFPELQGGDRRKYQTKKSKSCKDEAEEENGGEAGNR
ncbi:E3 ubiquitin-protein ligase RBBP6-like isoform X2 [Cololabis saira]|uniref:E3 ubiquitin-protein ligase RBBP6-like isoform X2 n=1 Tax=Cololabis saira TaxID=129043 RepID=UPI002AD5234A|nr:E3 ubiquitin-protein ligase RBBP6-like isoform X2 [Cololabis saira]